MLASCPHLGGNCIFALAPREHAWESGAAPLQGWGWEWYMVFIPLMKELPREHTAHNVSLRACHQVMNIPCRSVSWAPFCSLLLFKCYLLWKGVKRKAKSVSRAPLQHSSQPSEKENLGQLFFFPWLTRQQRAGLTELTSCLMTQSISKYLFCEASEQSTQCLIKLFDETEQIDLSSGPLVDRGVACCAPLITLLH